MADPSRDYRNTPGYYYCHVCNAKRSHGQISTNESGDLLCLSCNNAGFVEKVSTEDVDEPSAFYSRAGPNPTRNADAFASDPFTSVLGMPLNVFIQDALRGTLTANMGHFNTQSPLDVGFHNNEFQNMFQRTLFGSFPNLARTNNMGRFQLFQGDFSRIINSFVSNPFDEQAMNQILQYVMDNDPNRYGPPPAAKRIIETLKEEILDEEEAKALESCAVCTEDFKSGERVHFIERDKSKCGHAFHVDCIIPWLKQHNTCPVCRYELPTDDESYNKQREYLRSRLAEEVQRNVGNGSSNSPPSDSNPGAPSCRMQ